MAFVRWADLEPLGGTELLYTGAELLRLVAASHAAGMAAGVKAESLGREGAQLVLRGDPTGQLRDDLDAVGRLLLLKAVEAAGGARLVQKEAPLWRLMPHLAAFAPELPPSAVPLLRELLDPSLRPGHGLHPYRRWMAAAAQEEIRDAARGNGRLRLQVGGDTHVGLAKSWSTQVNQDALAVDLDGDDGVLLVCDGVSLSEIGTGDVASRIATQVVAGMSRTLCTAAAGEPAAMRRQLHDTLTLANNAITRWAQEHTGNNLGGRMPPSTTLVGAVLRGPQVDLFALGDSRIYLVGPFGAAQLNPDHNVRLSHLRTGHWGSPDGGTPLISYLGHVDEEGRPALQEVWHRRLRMLPGEALVLCSDGVSDHAAADDTAVAALLATLVERHPPQEAAEKLVQAANARGGPDNATALVARWT